MYSLGIGIKHSVSRIGVRMFSFDPPSPVGCLALVFLFSDECWDNLEDSFDSNDVFLVESPARGTDDLPLLLDDSALEVGRKVGDIGGVISRFPLSREIRLGRL